MIAKRQTITLVVLLLISLSASANAQMSKDQVYSLFSQANESFRQANSTKDSEQAERLYEKAILTFEKIIDEGQIKNAKLYYNLGNAYFLKGDIGKAILNYRRAEKLDGSDTNIQKNLTFARSRRIDKVGIKTEKRVLQTLFFWHYDFAVKTKFLLTCIFFGIFCICVAGMIWFGKSAPWMIPVIICAVLTAGLLPSLIWESKAQAGRVCGVITIKEVVARQGDGQNYSPSFKGPLHAGTEFDVLESRPGWLHIKLFDDSDGWIPEIAADLI
jgi:tetratricopeptide (TPR) repeat protein